MTDAARAADRAAVRDNERVLGVMLCLHAVVHLAGFVLTWRLFEPGGFDYDDVWPDAGSTAARLVGVAWLAAAAAVLVVGARLAAAREVAPAPLVGAHALSLAVCLTAVPAARLPAPPAVAVEQGHPANGARAMIAALRAEPARRDRTDAVPPAAASRA